MYDPSAYQTIFEYTKVLKLYIVLKYLFIILFRIINI